MKLRIRGNSIRFRLTKSEVERLATERLVEEVVHFSPQNFSYAIEQSSMPSLRASFENGKLTVFVPPETARQWAESEQVGLEGGDGELRILLEKDFVCLTRREGEDESDNFPHPNRERSC